jgi:hypothetical protein
MGSRDGGGVDIANIDVIYIDWCYPSGLASVDLERILLRPLAFCANHKLRTDVTSICDAQGMLSIPVHRSWAAFPQEVLLDIASGCCPFEGADRLWTLQVPGDYVTLRFMVLRIHTNHTLRFAFDPTYVVDSR